MPWNTEEKLRLLILLLREGTETTNKGLIVLSGISILGHAALRGREKYVLIIASVYSLLFTLNVLTYTVIIV